MRGPRIAPCILTASSGHFASSSLLAIATYLLSCIGAFALDDKSPGYQPQKQTQWQRELFSAVQKNAARRSEAATLDLLAALDEPGFRAELTSCCPSVSSLSARELLEKLLEEIAYSEVVSAFVSDPHDSFSLISGMTMPEALNGSYFYNIWHRRVLHNLSFYVPLPLAGYAAHCSGEPMPSVAETNVSIVLWSDYGVQTCAQKPVMNTTVTIGTCTVVAGGHGSIPTVVGAVWQGNTSDAVLASFWDGMGGSIYDGVGVPCPSAKPAAKAIFPTTGTCGPIIYNTSQFFTTQDIAETGVYGLRPFKRAGFPQNLEEASERGFYSMINNYLIDQGSPLYGDVSVVFSSKVMRQAGLISPVDTGYASRKCNSSVSRLMEPQFHLNVNCSNFGFYESLGTLDNLNHLILDSLRFWQPLGGPGVLARHFARNEGAWGQNSLRHYDLITYLEVVPAGTFFYPEDIRFLIATFGKLFGTERGKQVRQWAIKQGWILVWSLGMNRDAHLVWSGIANATDINKTANNRIVDPAVALRTSAQQGLPLARSSVAAFNKQWKEVVKLRADPTRNATLSNVTWLEQWQSLKQAVPVGLQIEPLRPGRGCPKPHESGPECVGVNAHGACICYGSEGQELPLAFVL